MRAPEINKGRGPEGPKRHNRDVALWLLSHFGESASWPELDTCGYLKLDNIEKLTIIFLLLLLSEFDWGWLV